MKGSIRNKNVLEVDFTQKIKKNEGWLINGLS